jgi:peptidoglycan/LPS O-acetylase OafA/YrhL
LFFILSGFVLATGYRRIFARWPGWGIFGRFLWARLSRSYPLHLAVLAALVLAVLLARAVNIDIPHGGNLTSDLVRHVLLIQGWGGADSLTWNGPTWSLSAEFLCYLAIPLLVPVVLRFRTQTAVVAGYLGATALPLAAYSILGFEEAQFTYIAPLWRTAGEFVAGALLCQLMHVESRLPALVGRLTGTLAFASLIGLVVLVISGIPPMAIVPLAGLVILGLAQQRGALNTIMSSRPMLVSGELSVALFLTHVPWLLTATLVITPSRFPGAWGWLGVLLLVAGAVAVAVIARALIERPGQKLMQRMVRPPKEVFSVRDNRAAEHLAA